MHRFNKRVRGIGLYCFVLFFTFGGKLQGQCPGPNPYVQLSASDTVICLGESVTIYPESGSYILKEDFNDTSVWNPILQTNMPQSSILYYNPCSSSLDGTSTFWTEAIFPRILRTIDLDLTGGGQISFDMKYAIEDVANQNTHPCEGPNEGDEGVALQYSMDGGITWIDIIYFQPDGTLQPANPYTNTPWTTSTTQFTSWANYTFPVPSGAQVSCVRFRWIQDNGQMNGNWGGDNWGIDNIVIGGTTPAYWPYGNPFGYPTDTAFTITPTQDTILVLAIDTGGGAGTIYDSVTIHVNQPPQVSITSNSPLCAGDTLHLSASGGSTYSWTGPNGFTSNNQNTTTQAIVGIYTVTVTDANGCVNTGNVQVNVLPLPIANFSFLPNEIFLKNPIVQFNNLSTGANNWLWRFGDGATSTLENPTHTYSKTGQYCIRLLVTNNFGCQAETVRCLEVNSALFVFIPNTFTPNGDGLNELFKVYGTGATRVQMMIFNRWGAMIYHTGKGTPWNGYLSNTAKAAPMGTYVYKIQLRDAEYKLHEYIGKINLIR